ncbi:MAG: CoA pyrophosphatase, partial [Kiloniellales bacterium]
VVAVFEVPLDFLLRPESCQRHRRIFQGKERHFYAFPYEAHFIWGATAGMLVNLVEILGDQLSGNRLSGNRLSGNEFPG